MKIRLYSDLHNEFSVFKVPLLKKENETVLILAGDIGVAKPSRIEETITDFIEKLSYRFYKIIYVLGNHEFYGSEMNKVYDLLYSATDHLDNVVIMNDSHLIIDDIVFVGTTLWTSLKEADPLVMMSANDPNAGMNDYQVIKYNNKGQYSKLYPQITVQKYYHSRDYIFHIASEHRDKKVVVITHHAPSYRSVAEQFKAKTIDMILNYNYFSDLDNQIDMNENIVLWCHGHTHNSSDYNIGNCRVICNPRGYQQHAMPLENKFLNKELIIEV